MFFILKEAFMKASCWKVDIKCTYMLGFVYYFLSDYLPGTLGLQSSPHKVLKKTGQHLVILGLKGW